MSLTRISPTASTLMVICTVLHFCRYTHAYDVSGPVCKWNQSTLSCEKDPSKMIELLTSTNKMFGLLMRCQYATSKTTCNNMSQNTCIWENNACQISSKKLINQINDCFDKDSFWNEIKINQCKDELESISKKNTWIKNTSVLPASSCEDSVGLFNSTQDTCILMEYALQCSPTSIYQQRCRFGTFNGAPAQQLVSDLRYIMGISSMNVSSSLSLLESNLEKNLDINLGNLQLYDSCGSTLISYQCECQTRKYQYCNKSNTNVAIIIVPIVISVLLFFFICCYAAIRLQNTLIARQNIDRISVNVQLPARARTTTGQQTNNLETAQMEEIMESLPNLEFKIQKGEEYSESICCICLESLQEGELSTVLPCAHWFHNECLKEWIRIKGRNAACPLCNNTLYNTQLQQ